MLQLTPLKSSRRFAVLRYALLALIGLLAIGGSGCTSTSDATLATAKNLLPSWGQPVLQPTNPNFQYLRVSIAGRTALLILGEIDEHPLGRIESWYSAEGEVLKFQNGRIVGTGGLKTNWINLQIQPTPEGYIRQRDVMPGYHFGLIDEWIVRSLDRPPIEIQVVAGLTRDRIDRLNWKAEMPKTESRLGRTLIGYEKGADGSAKPVVGYQCIDGGLCMQWERL